eukprot:3301097-Amphidinium_carterae.1
MCIRDSTTGGPSQSESYNYRFLLWFSAICLFNAHYWYEQSDPKFATAKYCRLAEDQHPKSGANRCAYCFSLLLSAGCAILDITISRGSITLFGRV